MDASASSTCCLSIYIVAVYFQKYAFLLVRSGYSLGSVRLLAHNQLTVEVRAYRCLAGCMPNCQKWNLTWTGQSVTVDEVFSKNHVPSSSLASSKGSHPKLKTPKPQTLSGSLTVLFVSVQKLLLTFSSVKLSLAVTYWPSLFSQQFWSNFKCWNYKLSVAICQLTYCELGLIWQKVHLFFSAPQYNGLFLHHLVKFGGIFFFFSGSWLVYL